MFNERGCQAKPGALVVLIFRPNLRLAVLIELVLIKKSVYGAYFGQTVFSVSSLNLRKLFDSGSSFISEYTPQ